MSSLTVEFHPSYQAIPPKFGLLTISETYGNAELIELVACSH
jgi:hypothetical protein